MKTLSLLFLAAMTISASAEAINPVIVKSYTTKELEARAPELNEGCYLSSDCRELDAIYKELRRRGRCFGDLSIPHYMWHWHKCAAKESRQ